MIKIEYEPGNLDSNFIFTEVKRRGIDAKYTRNFEKDGYTLVYEPGDTIPPPEPLPPTQYIEVVKALIEAKIDERFETFVAGRYISFERACGFKGSSVKEWNTEGTYCFGVRDKTWLAAYKAQGTLLEKYSLDISEVSPFDMAETIWTELEPQLPVLEWPEGSREG